MKKIIFVGQSLDNIKKFSHEARQEAGHQLDRVQCGKDPLDWKPMQGIGSGVLKKLESVIAMGFIE